MSAETFEQWWERDGSRYEYAPQAAEEAWYAATKAAEEKFTSTNTGSPKCLCYSTSESMDGTYYLIRNDCPVHKGALRAGA
jgi:hypothetical protein